MFSTAAPTTPMIVGGVEEIRLDEAANGCADDIVGCSFVSPAASDPSCDYVLPGPRGGAEDDEAIAHNRRAFLGVKLRTRVAVDVSKRSTQTTLFGKHVMISRTGYTGERGYEIFCRREDALEIWDTILEEGKEMGIIPCSFTTLDWLRVESYLLFYPYDNSQMYPFENEGPGDTLWELGLDFTVSPGKTGFRGAEEHYRLQGKERFKIYGVIADTDQVLDAGDELWADGKKVGIVTCGMHSRATDRSLAIARMDVAAAVEGTKLEVKGANVECSATAHPINFDDPDKKKRTAKG